GKYCLEPRHQMAARQRLSPKELESREVEQCGLVRAQFALEEGHNPPSLNSPRSEACCCIWHWRRPEQRLRRLEPEFRRFPTSRPCRNLKALRQWSDPHIPQQGSA